MKRAALAAAATFAVLAASSAPLMAFGAVQSSTPRYHHERVRHTWRSAGDLGVSAAEQRARKRSRLEHARRSPVDIEAIHNSELPDANTKVSLPSAEWDCNNGDAGCTWEPYGWRRN